jgi:SAM-dependent methyltransferase
MGDFSIKDYIRMAKAKGIRLPVQYFFQNHLFDLKNGTDTHFRLEKKDYKEQPKGFDSGILYMSSVTKEVKMALGFVQKNAGQLFPEYQFFDLGCGKGKSILIYAIHYGKIALHRAVGIEYYQPLAEIANKNLSLIKNSEKAIVFHDDARNYRKHLNSNKLIIYLYNPFSADILADVLQSCIKQDVYIIYTDPAHRETVLNNGFKQLFSKKGHYPNRNTDIYFRMGI